MLLLALAVVSTGAVMFHAWTFVRDQERLIAWVFDPIQTHLAIHQASLSMALGDDFEALMHASLDEGNLELAESYAIIAQSAEVELSPALQDRLTYARSPWVQWPSASRSFLRGFVFGESDDLRELSGAVASDFMVIGDIRDLAHQGMAHANGEEVDQTIVALSTMGIALSLGTAVTAGGSATLKVGTGTLKRLMSGRHLSPGLRADLARMAGRALPKHNQAALIGDVLSIKPFAAGTDLSKQLGSILAKHVNKAPWNRLQSTADDMRKIEQAAGPLGSLRVIRHAEHVRDLQTLAKMAPLAGKRTIALEKLLGPSFKGLAKTTLKWGTQLWLAILSLASAILGIVLSACIHLGSNHVVKRQSQPTHNLPTQSSHA